MSLHEMLHDLEDGQEVVLTYDSSYGDEVSVRGVVHDAHLSEWTAVKEALGRYTVIGDGFSDRERGEVLKRKGGTRRKVGEYIDHEVVK